MAVLIDITGNEHIKYPLSKTNTLGRDGGNTIRLQDNLISRTHAEISKMSDGKFRLVDLNSTHGTYVAGKKITDSVLSDGDEIIMGATRMLYQDSSTDSWNTEISQITSKVSEPWVQERLAINTEQQFPRIDLIKNEQELKHNYEKLRVAYELGRVVGLEDNVDTLLEHFVSIAFQVLAADRVAVLLVDPKTGLPKTKIVRKRTGGSERIILSRTVIQEVVSKKTGMILTDTGQDVKFRAAQSIISEGIRSAMCVPILYGSELLGVLHMDSLYATNVFSQKDLEVFSSIAQQAGVTLKNAILRDRIQTEVSARVQLQRCLSPNIADEVISGRLRLQEVGTLNEITVLFSDIRGFTQKSETMEPKAIVAMLNAYFEVMVEILFKYKGTLDKYIGDALMALFGAPVPIPDASFSAVQCALEMIRRVNSFNKNRIQKGRDSVEVGIGIHTGQALCGAMGSRQTRQYTAIGDTVNTASRLCSVAHAGQVIISEETMMLVEDRVHAKELPATHVKGKQKALKLYHVIDER